MGKEIGKLGESDQWSYGEVIEVPDPWRSHPGQCYEDYPGRLLPDLLKNVGDQGDRRE